jgi:hypothetical protein
MTTDIIPFVVLFVSVLVALRMPLGRDLLIPAFLQPWFALTPDIGVSISLSKIIFGVLMIKYFVYGRLNPSRSSPFFIYIFLLILGIGAALFSVPEISPGIEFAGGNFRNGWLRVLASAINLTLGFAPIFLLLAKGVAIPTRLLMRTTCISITILCLTGIVQFLVFVSVGVDILPIGMFSGGDDLRSGLVSVGGIQYIRPGALAGEPKSLGLCACVLVILLFSMGRYIFAAKAFRYFALGTAVLTMVLTQSTSAFVSLCIGISVYIVLYGLGRALRGTELFFLYAISGVVILLVFVIRVSSIDSVGLSSRYLESPTSISSLLERRTIDRLQVEDFDVVILKYMIENPISFITGKGLGLAHIGTDGYIPQVWRYYMEDKIIFPKTGLTFYLSNGGIFSVLLFMFLMVALTPGFRGGGHYINAGLREYVTIVQRAVVPLMFVAMIRIYVLELSLMVGAILAFGLQQTIDSYRASIPYGAIGRRVWLHGQ